MENPENVNKVEVSEEFKKAFELSEGFDINAGGMIQHFNNKQEYLDFLDDINNRDNR